MCAFAWFARRGDLRNEERQRMAREIHDTLAQGLTGTVRPLSPEAEVVLLRVAQEVLANVAKHARAGRVGVTLSYLGDEVALDVRDDGGGISARVPVARTA
jgi:signal transduction histidine kinase